MNFLPPLRQCPASGDVSGTGLAEEQESTMEMMQLGADGPEVSKLGLGCMRMSGPVASRDDAESVATIRAALDAGVKFLDTGDYYGAGHNEMLVGQAIKDSDEKALLSVKFGGMRSACGAFLGIDVRPAAAMPDGCVFGHIRRAKHLTISCVGWVPAIADEECGRPLGGVSVIVSQNIRIGLHEESNIGVADPLADRLRAYAGPRALGVAASRNPDVARLRTSSGGGSPLSGVQAPCPVYVRSSDQLNASAEFSASYATHKCT
jgi:hypothetical protein